MLISRQAGVQIVPGVAKAVGQARRVDRRLGGAGADMRARHESGIAGKNDAAEYKLWGFEIEDRLKERIGANKNFGNLRRQERLGVGFDPRDDVVADQRRWNAGRVVAARRIGAHIGER